MIPGPVKSIARMKGRKAVEALFGNGRGVSIFPLRAVYLVRDEPGSLRCGVSVSKRHFKKAVHRNRIKRLLREAWRHACLDLEARLEGRALDLFVLYTDKALPDYSLILEKMPLLLEKIARELKTEKKA